MKNRASTSTGAHPIAVVAERTGLTQDVLRIWERRYGVVEPGRGPGGQRIYTDADVDRLRLLHAATRAGRAISQIARISTKELRRLVDDDAAARHHRASMSGLATPEAAVWLGECLAHTRGLDAPRLRDTLRRAAALLGSSAFLESVAAPLMRRVGDEWFAGQVTPAQEHLASAAVHDVVSETIRRFTVPVGAPRIVIATPAGERHAIGALLVAAAAAIEGWNIIYLGADLPAADIAAAAAATDVRIVALSLVYVERRERAVAELELVRAQLTDDIELWVGGAAADRLQDALVSLGIRVCSDLAEFRDAIRRMLGVNAAPSTPTAAGRGRSP